MTTTLNLKNNNRKQFDTAQTAWFWALREKNDYNKICNPQTICRMVDRLYRQRYLSLDHYRVLYFYGMKQKTPDRHDMSTP